MMLSAAQIEQRKTTLIHLLKPLGDLRLTDAGRNRDRRGIVVEVNAPLDAPYTSHYFKYEEIYLKTGREWEFYAYYYEFQQRPPPGRRAHHWHDPLDVHQHCVDPEQAYGDDHYEGNEVAVFDAHREFLYRYASEEPITCDDLTPL